MASNRGLGVNRPASHSTTLAWLRSGLLRDWRGPLGALIGTWFNLPLALGAAAVLGITGGFWGYIFGGAGLQKVADNQLLRDIPLLETLIRSFAGQAGSPLFSMIGLLIGVIGGFLGGLILPWSSGIEDPLTGIGQLTALIVCAGAMGAGYTVYRVLAERWLLHQSGARPLSRREAAVVLPLLAECGRRLQLQNLPTVLIDDRAGVAAHAYARHVVITSDLLRMFEFRREPIEAVLAHELVHWANGDEITQAFVRGVALPLYLIRNVVSWLIQQFPHPLLKFGLYTFAWPFSLTIRYIIMPMQRMDSRAAEFRADKGAVLAGFRQGMREVLGHHLALESGRTGWEQAVCATHPPVETRLERLEEAGRAYSLGEEEARPERTEPSTDPELHAVVWPPQERHRAVWVGVGAAIVAMMLLLGVLSVVQSAFFTPERTVKAFFADLADHHGRSALAHVDLASGGDSESGSAAGQSSFIGSAVNTALIPAQVLAAKDYQAPTQSRIVSTRKEKGSTVVRVRYHLGDVDTEADLELRWLSAGVLDHWKIVGGLASMSVSADGGEFSVNGMRLATDEGARYSAYAPPGIYTVSGPRTALTEITARQVTVQAEDTNVVLKPSVTADARSKIESKVRQYLDTCAKSTSASPPGCPFSIGYSYYELTNIKWQIVTYPKLIFTPTDMASARVESDTAGVAKVTASYANYTGTDKYSDRSSFSVSGTAKVDGDDLQWVVAR